MNNQMMYPAPATVSKSLPVCVCTGLRNVPGIPRDMLACSPLLSHRQEKQLLLEFQSAPQFAGIDPQKLVRASRGSMGVILLTESDYYARQAAVYLATLAKQHRDRHSVPDAAEDFWRDVDDYLVEDEEPDLLETSLAVIHPRLLDSSIAQAQPGTVQVIGDAKDKDDFALEKLASPAVLLSAPSGRVLSNKILSKFFSLSNRPADHPLDLFIALKRSQLDPQMMEELRFRFGFHVCRVGHPDHDYLRRLLSCQAEELGFELAFDFDPDQVIQSLRRYRGSAFEETDLQSALLWAVQENKTSPLCTRDLIFHPYEPEKSGAAGLARMVGLEEVKSTLRRMIKTAAFEERRRLAGKPTAPSCRNMAFAGPPGTGKSVTARLVAQVLLEEGVGTGRFVEAGREQIIGSYLGQTSPMVAKLFEQAQGGVLFIDEAGSLLGGGKDNDIYATEAVNALVRHTELHPETLVIFATYPGEMEQLLSANPGLSSRVAKVLQFPAYDDAQLWDILGYLARESGYVLPEEAKPVCREFFQSLRKSKGDNFGNGREARRLFQSAVEELALRSCEDPNGELSREDFDLAAQRLLEQSGGKKERTIGFF